MQNKYKNNGVVLVAMTDEASPLVKPFAKKHKINYIVGLESGKTRSAYGVRGYPTVFVLGRDGNVLYVGHNPDEAEKTIENALKKDPPKKEGLLAASGAKSLFKKAEGFLAKKKYAAAIKEYEKIAKLYKDTEHAAKAKSKLKELKADKVVQAAVREAEAKKKCDNWLQLARTLAKSGKTDEARSYYERVIKEFPDSSFADTAKQEMSALDS
jgi:tetratricopeptide (TPR) repeat protein